MLTITGDLQCSTWYLVSSSQGQVQTGLAPGLAPSPISIEGLQVQHDGPSGLGTLRKSLYENFNLQMLKRPRRTFKFSWFRTNYDKSEEKQMPKVLIFWDFRKEANICGSNRKMLPQSEQQKIQGQLGLKGHSISIDFNGTLSKFKLNTWVRGKLKPNPTWLIYIKHVVCDPTPF